MSKEQFTNMEVGEVLILKLSLILRLQNCSWTPLANWPTQTLCLRGNKYSPIKQPTSRSMKWY